MHAQTSRTLLATVAIAVALPLAASPAWAAATVSAPLAEHLAGPLGLAVGTDGTVYVAQSFAGTLTQLDKHGGQRDLLTVPDGEVVGLAAKGQGTLVYTTTGGNAAGPYAALVAAGPNGKTRTLADLAGWETARNPDSVNHYGFSDLSAGCAAQVPPEVGGGRGYQGAVDFHPYAVTGLGAGWVVADAAGNDLVGVLPDGRLRTVAVLPPQPAVLTREAVAAFNAGTDENGNPAAPLPDCVVGHTYAFEPVPTDVELGPDGALYVSTLAGGPEDASLGARSSVYRVVPETGALTRLATGFGGATNLAVADDGTVYVAELFADRISKVVGGGAQSVVALSQPAALEWADGKLYATRGIFGPAGGDVVTVTLS